MPDLRKHRGPHPEDGDLFAPAVAARLRQATADLCWLMGKGYATPSALKLVGDRYGLVARQRIAVGRAACSPADAAARQSRAVDDGAVHGQELWLDAYNVLTTIEAAMAGGVILAACDGAYRDMASMHGNFRRVAETAPSLEFLGRVIGELGPSRAVWCLDAPVSNSGRLKKQMEQLAAARGWIWQVQLVPDPDPLLAASAAIVATADSVILDRCGRWFNLARRTITRRLPTARVLDLAGP